MKVMKLLAAAAVMTGVAFFRVVDCASRKHSGYCEEARPSALSGGSAFTWFLQSRQRRQLVWQ
ncbi:MAG: hypothetical protein Ct9H300mP16_04830 [Pseudomonadota bacterium]|nr:MAG: hypothetical protein Ct9H300mP16_04830 [Pseudomonadota bacterium]